jgi:NAD(P)-dependent dehydrogenase (short-subunit alcohol dehydrogenase family)
MTSHPTEERTAMALGTAVNVGGPGLGLALARTFADVGHPVAMLALDKAKLDTYAAEVASTGQDVRGYVADAADPANLRAALHSAITELGAPDVLVYNVGVLREDSPIGGDDQYWANVTAANVLGARVAADAVLPELRDGSRSRRRSAATRASNRPHSPGHTSNWTTSPRLNGSPSLSFSLFCSDQMPSAGLRSGVYADGL